MVLFETPAESPRWMRWFVYSPVARIAIFALVALGLAMALAWGIKVSGWNVKALSPSAKTLIRFGIQLAATVLAYLFLVKAIERRKLSELSARQAVPFTVFGNAAGALLITAVIALMWLGGAYRIEGTNPNADWIAPLLTGGLGAAVSEEIVFRGVIYRISEEGLGTGWALAISGLFFGGVHLLNSGATLWSALAIAIEAGLLLGLIYHLTRSLWMCIGMHMGWNFTQGTVWGVPVSGTNEPGLLVSSRPGPEWLSGGAWGAEGSLVAVLLNLAVALALLQLARRRNTLVPARRRRTTTMPAAMRATATPVTEAPC